MKRESWDAYFMRFAHLAATRSTCLRRKVGAVLVVDRHVVATGYNGPPRGIEHCESRGCLRKELKVPSGQRHELCWGLHAEQNAIIQAARTGVVIVGATLYCTDSPCLVCAKMLVNAGVRRVVFAKDYPDKLAVRLFAEAGLVVEGLEIG